MIALVAPNLLGGLQTTPPEHIAEGTTMSTLTILHAEKTDTGNYTCHPTQLEVASVMLHVLECEYHSVKKSRAKNAKTNAFLA